MAPLTIEAAARLIRTEVGARDAADLIGVEIEWHVRRPERPLGSVPLDEVREATAGVLERLGGTVTFEPGGQLEVSSQPAARAVDVVTGTEADMDLIRSACACAGLELVGGGMDPLRPPRRLNDSARYVAMEAYFRSREGSERWGRDMMCSTAATQVNVSHGGGPAPTRWQVAHDLGPVLVAAFASSPLRKGIPTGWKSTRQMTWSMLDPSRTRPADRALSPEDAWVRYALDAQVMFLPDGTGGLRPATRAMTLRDWLDGHGEPAPTPDDLHRHLSTLFPPVRPRGWLEMRMIDMPPDGHWAVPTAVVDALVRNADAVGEVSEICRPVTGAWLAAARHGLDDTALRKAARSCFELALDVSTDTSLRSRIREYHEEFVLCGRTPADAMLDSTLPLEVA